MANKVYDLVTINQKQFLEMVGELPFSSKQLNLLMQKTPPKFIKNRVIPGGGSADFVETHYVIGMLNLITGYQWDFDVLEEKEAHDQIIIRGKLTIHAANGKVLSKTQYGRATIKYRKNTKDTVDYGNDFKSAVSDAIKKCASLFGVAWDVYGKEDMREMQIVDTQQKEANEAEAQAEVLNKPIEEVKAAVNEKLDAMATIDRIKALKEVHHTNVKQLTDLNWRQLHRSLGLDELQSS